MRAMTRVKAAIAASMAIGLAMVAAPAFAADEPVLVVANTSFESGTWGDGIDFTVTGIPADVNEVYMTISASYAQGGGRGEGVLMTEGAEGVFTGTLIPEGAPEMPDNEGYPIYQALAYYEVDVEGQDYPDEIWSNVVDLTVTEGMTVTGPATATAAELAAGVELQFKGFDADETLQGEIELYDSETNETAGIGTFSATMGADGSGAGTLTVTGTIAADSYVSIIVQGARGEVSYGLRVIANAVAPVTPAPTAPAKPVRVETGV